MMARDRVDDGELYPEIERLLDDFRRAGVSEEQVRSALLKAWQGSQLLTTSARALGGPRRR